MSRILLIGLVASAMLAIVRDPVQAEIVAHYSFDEGSGVQVNDTSGNGNTLTFGGTPTLWNPTGVFGGSVSINGQSALARSGGTNPNPTTVTNFQAVTGNQVTVAFWAKPDTENVKSNPFYVGTSNSTTGNRVLSSHLEWDNNRVYWDVGQGGGGYQRLDVVNGASADKMHHYALTYDGATGGLQRIYKDATPIANRATTTTADIGWANIQNIEVGAFTGNSYWKGTLDDFAVWDESLATNQVVNVMNYGVQQYAPEAVIVPNTLSGRFIRVNKTKPNGNDVPFHIGEVQALLLGEDFAYSGQGASASTIHGSVTHGGDGSLVNNRVSTSSGTWTRDDAITGTNVYEVEALIDLGQTRDLQNIQLMQRGDCCPERLKDFTITLEADDGSGVPGAVVASEYFGGQAPQTTNMALALGQTILPGGDGVIGTAQVGQNARFIRVQNNGGADRPLHTSEIEAFAPGVIPNNNSAPSSNDLGGTGFYDQQGLNGHGSVNAVFDGNLQTADNTWSRDGLANYYTLDLGASTYVGDVRLWQRADSCCQSRLSDFSVSLLTDDGTGNPGGVMASKSFSEQVPTNSYTDLSFTNTFTIGADDTLRIELDPEADAADLFAVGPYGLGDLIIEPGATLEVSLLSEPIGMQLFNILDFGTITGSFDTINLQTLPEGVFWDTSNLHLTGVLGIVPEPSSFALATLGLLAMGWVGWRRRRRRPGSN